MEKINDGDIFRKKVESSKIWEDYQKNEWNID